MELKEQLKKALAELRKGKERKFEQTVDLIVNLQKFDIKKSSLNIFTAIPHKVKDKKVCGFLEVENKLVKTITPEKFKLYSDKTKLKKLEKEFDFFIAQASLMPKVATTFGRALGPSGKMPSPQMGILINVTDKEIEGVTNRINSSIKIKTKEASIKVPIGKEKMSDEDLIENIMTIYNVVVKELPQGKENIKNIQLKFTMTKPIKIGVR